MHKPNSPRFSFEEAAALLEVASGAGDDELRRAYLQQLQAHPPDRDPELFEQIRDAYEQLRDPALRARQILQGPDPALPLPSLLEGFKPQRRFVGSGPWMNLLKENRS